jgi:hypothetical protein
MTTTTLNRPWDRQPKETTQAWEARRLYVQMGPSRSIDRVGQGLGKSRALMERWSVRWEWVLSAKAFDSYIDEIASKQATERMLAEKRADDEKLALRVKEIPELVYKVFIDAYNDIAADAQDVKDGKKRVTARDKAMKMRSFIGLAELARDIINDLASQRAQPTYQPANDINPARQDPGRALAVLRAFNEWRS